MAQKLYIDRVMARNGAFFGMTICPGKNQKWRQPRDLASDLASLRRDGTTLLVTLMEEFEFEFLGLVSLDFFRDCVLDAGMDTEWYPIIDGSTASDTNAFDALVDELVAASVDNNIVVHCRGGLGRTGTLVACLLIALGDDPNTAVEKVRSARPGTIENMAQLDYVYEYARRHGWKGHRTIYDSGLKHSFGVSFKDDRGSVAEQRDGLRWNDRRKAKRVNFDEAYNLRFNASRYPRIPPPTVSHPDDFYEPWGREALPWSKRRK